MSRRLIITSARLSASALVLSLAACEPGASRSPSRSVMLDIVRITAKESADGPGKDGWTQIVGGSHTVHVSNQPSPYGNGLEDQVTWGVGATPADKNGLAFTGNHDDQRVAAEGVFEIGRLRHFNCPSMDNAWQADLTISMAIAQVSDIVDFTFTMQIETTPNIIPCAYPGSTVCPDRIILPSYYPTQSFVVGGQRYTLEILGFADRFGEPWTEWFVSEENGTNWIQMFGRITAVPADYGTAPPTKVRHTIGFKR